MDLLLIWCITATVAAVTSMVKTDSYYLKDFQSCGTFVFFVLFALLTSDRMSFMWWLKLSKIIWPSIEHLQTFKNPRNYLTPWNNGKEVPRWGVAEIEKLRYRKWVPQQLGDVNTQESGDSRPMQWEPGMATWQPITQICCPGVVELVYLLSRRGQTCEF